MNKSDCLGCEQNFYNGNNSLGVKECWNFPTAMLAKRLEIPVNMPPPYLALKPISKPKCYRAAGYVYAGPEVIDSRGFWKG